jgi:hypothetical protein
MNIGIFFRGNPIPLQKVSDLLWMFKNTKYSEYFYNDFNWQIAVETLAKTHNINLWPGIVYDVNFLWDCSNDSEVLNLIELNPSKKFYELSPLNLDHHNPKKPNTNLPNLFYLVSEITDDTDCIFDLGLLLNRYVYHQDWNFHYYLRETFKLISNKNYRMDFSLYLPFKPNRIKYSKYFYKKYDKLFYSINNFHILNIKNKNIHTNYNSELSQQYKRMEEEYDEDLEFFYNLEPQYITNDFSDGNGGLDYKINFRKFTSSTIKSDISILMETWDGHKNDMQKNLVTEKTYDMLAIGKPFIAMCPVTDEFINKFKFVNYKKLSIFSNYNTELEIIDYILTADESTYQTIKTELYLAANENIKIFDTYVKNNTFIENIINENK